MGQLDLFHLQDGFASLVKQADPEQLPSFFLWLDLKVAQFKVTGNFIPDNELAIQNVWLQHITRRLFDKDEKKLTPFANGSSGNSITQADLPPVMADADTSEAINARLGTNLPAGDFSPPAHSASPRFDVRSGRDCSISSGATDVDLHRVMLKVPTLLTQETCSTLEPIDFSCIEKKARPEGKDSIRSLLREALCKTRSSTAVNELRFSPQKPPGSEMSSPEKWSISNGREMRVDENVLKLTDEQEKNSCPYCSKTFQYRSSYRRHIKIHQGIFSHMCYVCGRKFTRKEHYVRHKCNRRPNKPNRGQDAVHDPNVAVAAAGIFQSDCHLSTPEAEVPGREPEDSKADIKLECCDGVVVGEVSFVDDATDEECGRLHESRRKSSTPRKIIVANDSLSDVSDTEPRFGKLSVKESLFSELEDEANIGMNTIEGRADSLKVEMYTDEDRESNVDRLSNGPSSEAMPNLARSRSIPGTPEKSAFGAGPGFLNLQTGSYKVEEIDDDDTSDSGKAKVITIKKQAKYLKLKNEAHIVDGSLCFSCPHCFKTFHRSSNFSRHMRIHRGVYSYICQTCSRGFFRREHFQKHKCHRKSMSTVCDRRTKFELLHNVDAGDSSPLENSGDFVDWPSSYCASDAAGSSLLIPASMEMQ